MRLSPLRNTITVVTIAAVLTVASLLCFAGGALAAPPWSDASASWWSDAYGVAEAEVATVADGYPDGTFRPAVAVTRGQFAKMAVNGLGVNTACPAVPTFKDVPASHIFYSYAEGAYAGGLIGGYSTSSGLYYRPDNTITRQQAMSILGRYLSKLEIDTTGVIHGDVNNYGTLELWYAAEGQFYLTAFEDWAYVAVDHRATIAYLKRRGIVEGSNSRLNPTATLVRAQAVALTLRVKAQAVDIQTPPSAPTNVGIVATGTGVSIIQTGVAMYVGNDPTPRVTGDTLPGCDMAIYDQPFYGTNYIKLDTSNLSGRFYVDIDDAVKPLLDGAHSFTAKVMNDNGLVSAASEPVIYLLDTVLPSGLITAPSIGEGQDHATVNSARPTFAVSATDERSGIRSVRFEMASDVLPLDWKTISTDVDPDAGTTIYTVVWPLAGDLGGGLSDGEYQFRAVVTDIAGNERTVGPVNVVVDATSPTATIVLPVPNSGSIFYTGSTMPMFAATAVDAGSTGLEDIQKVEFFYALWSDPMPTMWGQFTLISSDDVAPYAAVYVSALPEGRYIFAVRATDIAGNESLLMNGASYRAGVTQEVIIDGAAPTATITSPAAGVVNSIQPTFTATAEDAISGVAQVAFQYATSTAPDTWITISTDTAAPYDAAWGSTVLEDGASYGLRAVITDNAGNTYTTPAVNITVGLPD